VAANFCGDVSSSATRASSRETIAKWRRSRSQRKWPNRALTVPLACLAAAHAIDEPDHSAGDAAASSSSKCHRTFAIGLIRRRDILPLFCAA
jgi:hypothetical protein